MIQMQNKLHYYSTLVFNYSIHFILKMSDWRLTSVPICNFVPTNMNHSEDTNLIIANHHRSVTVVPHRFDMH